ncbi:MAG: ABC transporter permease, partial [Pseudomonadales bacterium]|nr:ABC transporter permease [Pseudomonadales bacterium]
MASAGNGKASLALSRFIATRYVSAGKRSHLVSFMSAISIAGLALGVAILIIVLSVMNGFDREMRDNILNIVPHITFSTEENLSDQEWQELADLASAASGVSSVSGFIQVTGVIANNNFSKGVLINGLDVANDAGLESLQQFVRSGSIDALNEQRWGIVLGQTLANNLGVSVGDEIDLFSTSLNINPLAALPTFRPFTVTGIFRVGTQELDSELVIINQTAARALFRLRSSANGLRLQTDNVLEANALARGMADS